MILQQKKQQYNATQHFEDISHPLLYSLDQGCFVGYAMQAEVGSEANCTIRNKQFLIRIIRSELVLEVNNRGSLPKTSG